MEEITLWNLLASGRIGNALGVIALILIGWLALRYANAVRESGDANMAHKCTRCVDSHATVSLGISTVGPANRQLESVCE